MNRDEDKENNKYIPLTEGIANFVISELKRTGVSPEQYAKDHTTSECLTVGKIRRWCKLQQQTLLKSDLDEFTSVWGVFPDAKPRIKLTPARLQALNAERERTGLSYYALFKDGSDLPEDLSEPLVGAWMSGSVISARKDHFEAVLCLWQSLPDSSVVEITLDLRQKMKDEAERTGVGPAALMRGIRPSQMGGLHSSLINSWMAGRTTSAERDWLQFVLDRWENLPDHNDVWMELSERDKDYLRSELKRTGVSVPYLLKDREDIPDKLYSAVVHNALGRQPRIRKEHFNYLKRILSALPDAKPGATLIRKRNGHSQIPLTDDMRQALVDERTRTGVSDRAISLILASRDEIRPMAKGKIAKWIRGGVKSVSTDEFDAVLAAWKELPDRIFS